MSAAGSEEASSAPRVLISGVVLAQPMGGVRRHNAELLPRVAKRLAAGGGGLAILEGRQGIPFELPPSVERIPSTVPAGPPVARALREARALERALTRASELGRPFDLVHSAHLPAPPRHLSRPWTLTIHDLRSLHLAHTPFSRRFFAKTVIGSAVRNAAHVFTVSETVRSALIEGFGLPSFKVSLVPNAADHFEPLPRCPPAERVLLHLGHVEPRKNLGLLLEVLALDASLPRLVLAGASKNQERERLDQLARKLGVAERLSMPGPFDEEELAPLLARAACVILPSHLEGFGISVLEAQRARVPLAISNLPALVEVAGAEVPSFAPDDAESCRDAIRSAMGTDPETLERHARLSERYRWEESAERWVRAWISLN